MEIAFTAMTSEARRETLLEWTEFWRRNWAKCSGVRGHVKGCQCRSGPQPWLVEGVRELLLVA